MSLRLNMEHQYQSRCDFSSAVTIQVPGMNKAETPLATITIPSQECVKNLVKSPHHVNNYINASMKQSTNCESHIENSVCMFADRSLITNFFPNNEEIIVPDKLSPFHTQQDLQRVNINKPIPKIRIKEIKQLQDPLYLKKNEQITLQADEPNNQYDQMPFTDVQAQLTYKNVEIVQGCQHYNIPRSPNDLVNSEINKCYTNCSLNLPINTITERSLKLKAKEKLLKERLMKLNKKQVLLCGVKRGRPTNISKILPSDSEAYSDTRKTNVNSQKSQIISECTDINSDLIINEPKINERDEENKQPNISGTSNGLKDLSTEKEAKEIDVTGLKEGIIEASRSLINTQKTLKMFAQIVSGGQSLKNQQAVILITKFQNVLKSFKKKLDGIDKTVKNQYKDFIPETINMDTLLKSIQEESKVEMMKSFKQRQTKKMHKYQIISSPRRNETVESIASPRKESTVLLKSDEVGKSNIESEPLNGSCKTIRQECSKDTIIEEQTIVPKVINTGKVKFRIVPDNYCNSKKRKLTRCLMKYHNIDEGELSDKSFKIPGSSAITTSAPLRVTPHRSCRQVKSYNFVEDEDFEYENS